MTIEIPLQISIWWAAPVAFLVTGLITMNMGDGPDASMVVSILSFILAISFTGALILTSFLA